MTVKDVAVYVKDTRGVHYKYSDVWEAPRRRKRHVPCGEGCRMDSRRAVKRRRDPKKGSGNRFTGLG